MSKKRSVHRQAARAQATVFPEDHKECIAEGRCGPIQRYACQPSLPTEEIATGVLRPEHLDELTSLAEGCLEAVTHVRLHGTRLVGNDDDRWWIQGSLVSAMTTALRAGMFLWAGLEREILQAYPSSVAISAAGRTGNNAHGLAVAIALDLVCRAWGAVYIAERWKPILGDRNPIHADWVFTYRRPLVRMRDCDDQGFPLFKYEHVPAVVNAIRTYPDLDADDIRGRIRWENAKVKERRAELRDAQARIEREEEILQQIVKRKRPPVRKAKRRRKTDSKAEERRQKKERQAAIDKEIFAEWRGETREDYQDYVDWKNSNLPEGWPELTRQYVERAIAREKARLKRVGKWPPK